MEGALPVYKDCIFQYNNTEQLFISSYYKCEGMLNYTHAQ